MHGASAAGTGQVQTAPAVLGAHILHYRLPAARTALPADQPGGFQFGKVPVYRAQAHAVRLHTDGDLPDRERLVRVTAQIIQQGFPLTGGITRHIRFLLNLRIIRKSVYQNPPGLSSRRRCFCTSVPVAVLLYLSVFHPIEKGVFLMPQVIVKGISREKPPLRLPGSLKLWRPLLPFRRNGSWSNTMRSPSSGAVRPVPSPLWW